MRSPNHQSPTLHLNSTAGGRFLRASGCSAASACSTTSRANRIYPLLPFFLTSVLGATAVSLGIIEGAAEAVSSVLKVVSGRLSDLWRRRKPIVLAGYSLSAIARPFISIANGWVFVFVLRFIDRVGKGIRSAPRDALLADLADPTNRGRVFGFHKAMDHTGAVVGPLLATTFLIAFPERYRTLFALTAIPGIATVVLLLFLRERPRVPIPNPRIPNHGFSSVALDPLFGRTFDLHARQFG